MKNRRVLISQAQPTDRNSSFFKLAEKFNFEISFTPLFALKPISAKEFMQQRINILDHSAIFFSSKNSIDFFFSISNQLKVEIPKEIKYFCMTELLVNYLQKHIVLRKRKIFVPKKNSVDIFDLFIKHKEEKFLVVGSQNRKKEITDYLMENGIDFSEAMLFRVLSNDISELVPDDFGMLVFFSPADVKSLAENFPTFRQNETIIACFGPSTISAATEAGLKVDIEAPQPQVPSMSSAIELYMKTKSLKSEAPH